MKRLIYLLKYQCSLNTTEAEACIRDYRQGFELSSEAVDHYGGTTKCLTDAILARKRLYRQHRNSPFEFWFYRTSGVRTELFNEIDDPNEVFPK